MSKNKLTLTIMTKSNLFIGGSPRTFEIGGVDAYTVVDYEGKPFIPGSSLKGTLRFIVKENWKNLTNGLEIANAYKAYLDKQQEMLASIGDEKLEGKESEKLAKKMNQFIATASPEYLFGIEGFNQSPKLLFSDIILSSNQDYKKAFSIDSKNSITVTKQEMSATPRTYKTVRPGIIFQGDILFQRMSELELDPKLIEKFIEDSLNYFNDGFYRLGNSGSRGYGRVDVAVKKGE